MGGREGQTLQEERHDLASLDNSAIVKQARIPAARRVLREYSRTVDPQAQADGCPDISRQRAAFLVSTITGGCAEEPLPL